MGSTQDKTLNSQFRSKCQQLMTKLEDLIIRLNELKMDIDIAREHKRTPPADLVQPSDANWEQERNRDELNTEPVIAPFGTHQDIRFVETPPPVTNVTQVWRDYGDIGRDFLIRYPNTIPLPEPQMQLLRNSNSKLNDIEFVKFLGAGCYGKVWSVTALKEKKRLKLACKIIQLDYNPETTLEDELESLLRETRILENLESHQNIVQLEDVIEIPDTKTGFPYAFICIFMGLCDGSLESIISTNLTKSLNKHWFRHIATGLEYLHTNNIVHLDAIPNNILYLKNKPNCETLRQTVLNSTFKLADFGNAFVLQPGITTFPVIKGNLLGMNVPEVVVANEPGAQPVEARPCDVYILGDALREVCHRSKNEFNIELKNFIDQMMSTDPKVRPTIQQVLSHQWLQ